jgi:hypothetical protein
MNDLAASKRVVAVINSVLSGEHPVTALDDVVADDFKDHAAFPGQRPGRDGFKDGVEKQSGLRSKRAQFAHRRGGRPHH